MGGKVLVFVESDSRAMPCVSDHQCRKKICKGPLYQSNAVDSESPDPFKMTSHIIFCKTNQDILRRQGQSIGTVIGQFPRAKPERRSLCKCVVEDVFSGGT